MVTIEDDALLNPVIDEDVRLYVLNQSEGHAVYTRFFDALLIKRSLHRSFYRDLKAFREQALVIYLLDQAAQDRNNYRKVTAVFLDSRYAHPWCRKTPLKKGFWRAEWGRIQGKQRDAEIVKEEQSLHKLLVPIWIIMRSRMFPGESVVRDWCQRERERQRHSQPNQLTAAALARHDEELEKDTLYVEDSDVRATSDSGLNAEDRRAAARAATSVLRLAAAGMILSQTPKRKLRWLTMKPT